MEARSNILLENPAFNAKCLNLSSIYKFESTQINLSLTGTAPLGGIGGCRLPIISSIAFLTVYEIKIEKTVKVPILFDLITNLFTYISSIYFALIQ